MLIDEPHPAIHTNTHEGMIIMAQFTTAQVAEKFDTTPRNLRKFLRADARNRDAADALPGKGARYSLEGKDLAPMKKRFKVWAAAEVQAKADRAAKAAEVAAVEVEADEVDEEPTAEDLAGEDPYDDADALVELDD